MSAFKKIIITGGGGNLGTKLKDHLEPKGGFTFIRLDKNARGNRDIVEADLTVYDDDWAQQFAGADVVIHLAADPSPGATWESLTPLNLDMTLNVFEASVGHGVKRIIFASSNHTMGGYQHEEVSLTPETIPKPGNAYGVTKLVGERIGKSFSDRHKLSVICFRIGWVQRDANEPGDHMGDWGRKMWLSNRDFCQLMEKAIHVENTSFVVVNAMSNNTGMKWDLSATRQVIGYEPQDNAYAPEWG